MTIFLIILIGITLIFDFSMNIFEAFTKKRRRIYFIVSNLIWYSVSVSLLSISVLREELQIWQLPNCWLVTIPVFIYFAVHICNGMRIYNCQEEPMFSKQINNSNFEKN